MFVFKASGIGGGLSVPYNAINYENNLRITSPFGMAINDSSSPAESEKYLMFRFHVMISHLTFVDESVGSITIYSCAL
jgi:hypothetical protein